jgi:hypothetical protein
MGRWCRNGACEVGAIMIGLRIVFWLFDMLTVTRHPRPVSYAVTTIQMVPPTPRENLLIMAVMVMVHHHKTNGGESIFGRYV